MTRTPRDLFFSERPADLEQAKSLCAGCPLIDECRQGALDRAEPWGVWGGAIFDAGRIIAVKRGRGRPRKNREQEVGVSGDRAPARRAPSTRRVLR